MHSESYFGNYREPVLAWLGTEGLAVVKPAGMHSAPGIHPDGSSLAEWVFQRYPAAAAVKGRSRGEGGLINRLDRDTEGLVLFALTDGFFEHVTAQAAGGNFVKSYLACVEPGCGGLDGSRPLLAAPLAVDGQQWTDALRRRDLGRLETCLSGSEIESQFRAYGPGAKRVACLRPDYTPSMKTWTRDVYRTRIASARTDGTGLFVAVCLTRGFRHQIRAHLAWIGLALKGDPLYGEGEPDRPDQGTETGLRLLAYALAFTEPGTDSERRISLPGLDIPDSGIRAC